MANKRSSGRKFTGNGPKPPKPPPLTPARRGSKITKLPPGLGWPISRRIMPRRILSSGMSPAKANITARFQKALRVGSQIATPKATKSTQIRTDKIRMPRAAEYYDLNVLIVRMFEFNTER